MTNESSKGDRKNDKREREEGRAGILTEAHVDFKLLVKKKFVKPEGDDTASG